MAVKKIPAEKVGVGLTMRYIGKSSKINNSAKKKI